MNKLDREYRNKIKYNLERIRNQLIVVKLAPLLDIDEEKSNLLQLIRWTVKAINHQIYLLEEWKEKSP